MRCRFPCLPVPRLVGLHSQLSSEISCDNYHVLLLRLISAIYTASHVTSLLIRAKQSLTKTSKKRTKQPLSHLNNYCNFSSVTHPLRFFDYEHNCTSQLAISSLHNLPIFNNVHSTKKQYSFWKIQTYNNATESTGLFNTSPLNPHGFRRHKLV